MARASLDYERSGGELTHVRISGTVDEQFDGMRAAKRIKSRRAVVNCAGIALITSFGIRRWLEFVQELERRGTQVYFVECNPKFVEELNQVVSFTAHGRVLSAYAPFTCPECSSTRAILLRVDADAQIIRTRQLPAYSCLACGAAMEFDDDVVSYFAGLEAHVEGPVEEPVQSFLEARLGYHAETDRQLQIKKLVFGDTTVVWFGGTLDGTVKPKLAEGLEGRVILNLSDILHVQQAGIRAWREFVGEAIKRAEALVLVGCPALIVERALEGLSGDTLVGTGVNVAKRTDVQVVSARIPHYCAQCDATEFVEVDLAGREGDEIRQGQIPRHTCAGCGSETRALVGAKLLDELMKLPAPTAARDLKGILQRAAKQIKAAQPRVARKRQTTPWVAAAVGTAVLATTLAVGVTFFMRGSGEVTTTGSPGDRPRFERPEWIISDVPSHSYCTTLGRDLVCVGVSAFHHTKEEGEKEAFEAAVEAMVRDVLLNVPDRRAATQKTLYEGRRQAALEALENVRYDEHGPTAPEALGVVRKGRAAVAAAVRFQKATGVPTRRTDWYWEEYKGEATAKSEFLVFVRLDMNSNERGAMIKHYTTPVTTGGATLLPAYPAAGWAVELDNKTALVVAKLGDGAMRAAGVRTGDLLLLDGDVAPGEVDRRLLAGVRGDDGAKLTIRRGRDLSQVFVPLIKAGGGSR